MAMPDNFDAARARGKREMLESVVGESRNIVTGESRALTAGEVLCRAGVMPVIAGALIEKMADAYDAEMIVFWKSVFEPVNVAPPSAEKASGLRDSFFALLRPLAIIAWVVLVIAALGAIAKALGA